MGRITQVRHSVRSRIIRAWIAPRSLSKNNLENCMKIETGGGLLGLLLLILMVYAVVKIVQSDAGTGAKVLWIVLILLLPVLGLILWALFGPKG